MYSIKITFKQCRKNLKSIFTDVET